MDATQDHADDTPALTRITLPLSRGWKCARWYGDRGHCEAHGLGRRQLKWFVSGLVDRFAGGVVFHTGPEAIEQRILAPPICVVCGSAA